MATQFGLGGYGPQYSPIIEDVSDQWLFTKEDLLSIPSSMNEYSTPPGLKQYAQKDARNWRTRGCNFIHNVVKRLDMHQIVASTACVYFHRFYMRQSIAQHHQYEIAGACVLIASKAEENKRGLKEISKACAIVALKGAIKKDMNEETDKWLRRIRYSEIIVLENCCFDLEIAHPYGFIDTLAMEFAIPVFVAKSATAHVNDTMRSPICLLYRPEIVAVAALYFAISVHRWEFTGCLFDSRLLKLSINARREAEACIMDILEFYQNEAEVEKEAFRQQQQHQSRPT
ncbi:hypothetical protein GGF40_001130 [Coemansia sp. RSA 1286]|nr:hypothetical protein IWW45_001833 [Coemansia sp. RSA 485]KAJ2639101.1 hypothetical protein GGF40_001130 [Coemansia sp. RSA 1286]